MALLKMYKGADGDGDGDRSIDLKCIFMFAIPIREQTGVKWRKGEIPSMIKQLAFLLPNTNPSDIVEKDQRVGVVCWTKLNKKEKQFWCLFVVHTWHAAVLTRPVRYSHMERRIHDWIDHDL